MPDEGLGLGAGTRGLAWINNKAANATKLMRTSMLIGQHRKQSSENKRREKNRKETWHCDGCMIVKDYVSYTEGWEEDGGF